MTVVKLYAPTGSTKMQPWTSSNYTPFSRGTKFYHCLGCTSSLAAESCDHLSWSCRTAQGFPLAHDRAWKQFHWRRLGTKHSGFNDWPPGQAGWEGSRHLGFKAAAVCTGVLLCPSCAFLNCQAGICPFLTLLSQVSSCTPPARASLPNHLLLFSRSKGEGVKGC